MGLYKVPWENLISHGTIQSHGKLIFPWEINIPMGIKKFPWDFVKVPWEFVKFPWEKNNPMGKFNFP